jgi:hypothetical protein
MAYWLDGILFVKFARYEPQVAYPDFGCSSFHPHWRWCWLTPNGPIASTEQRFLSLTGEG